jgi:plastocyanin
VSNETVFYICGIALALSAVVVSFVGLRDKAFPGRLMPLVSAYFAALVAATATFAVLNAQDEQDARAEEHAAAPGARGSGAAETGGQTAATSPISPGAEVFASNGCGGCHILAAANATGVTGPNLDKSLAPDDDFAAVKEMIVGPNAEIVQGYSPNVMPQNYGHTIPARQLTELVQFLLDSTPAGGGGAPAQPKPQGPGGTLQLAADPTQILFDKKSLSSKPGKVTIQFTNPAAVQHDVAIEKDGQVIAKSPLVAQGKTSVSAELAPGSYTFLCTVPGHAQAGMEGTLTVK